ncbi:MAG TPA: glycosyltransferase family 4 protein [Cryobacterium sp.]|nr:glycosyltransferase family 4 protein [Cryobacterium sp.]
MRVLWFTNMPLPAVYRRLSLPVPGGGGWMESLRRELCGQRSLELGVAAVNPRPCTPFDENGVRYFGLEGAAQRGRVGVVVDRWRHRSEDAAAVARALAVVREFGPDLIHVHGTEGPAGLLGQATDVPLVISLQGLLVACSRAFFLGIPPADLLRDVTSLGFAEGRGLVHSSWNMRVAARREVRIMKSCSDFTGRTAWDRDVVSVVNPRARYHHVEEVLRPEFYGHEWRPASDGPFVIYTTGGHAPYKGLVNLLEAVSLLRAATQRDVRLRVGGAVQGSQMEPIVKRAARRFGVQDAVTWLGPLAPMPLVSELLGASVYAHASVADNSPNSLAEAMLVGVPCVASAAGGIPSLLRDGDDGLLCASNDVYSLAGRLAEIEADAGLAARLGGAARVRGQQRHDPQTIAKTTLEVYADVVAQHGEAKP